MGIKRNLGVWWVLSLLSVPLSLAASGDLRLVEAAREGNRETVRSLLKQHVAVNIPQPDGTTALAWAAYRDDLEMADLVISAGANVNAADENGLTPLWLACTNRSAVMVDKLLKAKADPNAARWTGENVLMQCARTGNVEAVKSLLAHGARVDAKENRQGHTALMRAVAQKHSEVARVLIEHGVDVNARAKSGFTALMFAAQRGDMESARILLAAGANVNEVTNEESVWPGDTALLVASASGHEALSIFLLDNGADPNAADEFGFTALHFSLMKGLVLICGIRLNYIYSAWPTYLVRPNMPELVKALLAHGANPNVRIKKNGGDKLFRINHLDPPTAYVSPVAATPFLLAALTHDLTIMKILVAGGADPLLPTEGGVTPLMMAAGVTHRRSGDALPLTEEEENRALDAVELTVELGADVNAADEFGITALHGAAFTGSNRIIQYLVDRGANLDAKDKVGQTPLAKAMNIEPRSSVVKTRYVNPGMYWKSTVELLLKLGATPVNASMAQASDGAATTADK